MVGVCSGVVKSFLTLTNSFFVLLTGDNRLGPNTSDIISSMCISACTGIRAITALFSSHVVEC